MTYYSERYSTDVIISGNGVGLSLAVVPAMEDPPSVDWSPDQTCIPFGQIEVLTTEGCTLVDFPVTLFLFENLGVLRTTQWDVEFAQGLLRLLYPDPVIGVPCRSLREIECTCSPGSPEPLLMSLIDLVRERKRAGHQLGLVRLSTEEESNRRLVKELRKYVGRVRVMVRTTSTVVPAHPDA